MLQEYEWRLAQYLGAGVAACYRGYRLYDTDRTKKLVKKYVQFYKVRGLLTKGKAINDICKIFGVFIVQCPCPHLDLI